MLDYTCVVFYFDTFNKVSQGEAIFGEDKSDEAVLVPGCISVLPG